MAHPIILTLLAFTLCLTITRSTLVIKKERFSAPRDAVGAIQVADQFYFAGGFELNDYIPTNIVEIYNITSGEWEEPIFLEEPRGFISTAVIGQNIYFVAGSQFPNSCTMLYNSSLHQYEDIGCGPTVRTPIQVSNHNSTVTVLGAFSADFFNSSKQWDYIPTLTSWMQGISGGIKLVYENLIVGIGSVNSTTLQPLYAAWIYDTYTHNLTVFNSVTTASTFSSTFGFTVAHGRLVAYSSDRYFVHQFGTEEWHEVLLDSPTQAVVLSDVAFVFNITGYSVFDWSTNVANWTARITQRALSWDNQIVIVHDIFVLDIYEAGSWSSIVLTAEIIKAYRWFDKYIFYNPADDLRVYDSKSRSISTIPNTIAVTWDSVVSIDPSTLVLFVNGNAQIYNAETQQMSEAIRVNFIGDFAIGTDVISLGSRVLWFNFTQKVILPFNSVVGVSEDGSAIVPPKTLSRYQKINVYNYVTKTWLPSIDILDASVRINFSPVLVIDDMLIALLAQNTHRYNTTSGELLRVQDGQKPTYSTVNTVPVVDGVGYLPAMLVSSILQVNSTSIERVPQPGEQFTWQFVTKDNVMHISTNTVSQFLKIYTYDINTGTMDTFSLPKPQAKLSIAIVDSTLVALGSDGLAYAVNLNDKSIWYTAPFQYDFVSTISTGLHDRTVMVAGGKHYQLGHYTDEILFLNASVILESDVIVDLTPHASNNDTTPNNSQALTDGELAAAIVVPVVVVVGGVIALIVVLLKRRRGNKKKGSSNTVGLEARFGAWFTPFDQITFGEQLGQGASGQVFKGTWKNTTVALKVSMTQANTSVIAELELMMQLRPHPNVVQLLGFSVHPETDSIILIIEFCEGGSLDAKLYEETTEISFSNQIQWLVGVAKGLSHLHSNNIVHRDVAARNVLLHRNEPKLTDFGMSRLVDEQKQHGTTKSELGPIRWMSPESLKNKEYSTKSDIWSFGILMYEVTARQEPHSEADPIEIGRLIRDSGLTPVIPSSCHPQLADVMKQCWQMSPQSRPKIESIIESLESIQTQI